MTRDLIYEDNHGNKLLKDLDNRLVVLDKFDKVINTRDAGIFMRRDSVRIAMKRYFGDIPKIKILNNDQTNRLKKKIRGGYYS